MPQIESNSLLIDKTLALYGSLNVTPEQFSEGLIFGQIRFWYFTDVVVQIRYPYKICVNTKS